MIKHKNFIWLVFVVLLSAALSGCAIATDELQAAGMSVGQRETVTSNTETHENSFPGQVWSEANYTQLLVALQNLDRHGLDPEQYGLTELIRAQSDLMARDTIATSAWLKAASDLLQGKLDPVTMEPGWRAAPRQADLSEHLASALESGTVNESLESLAPHTALYQALQAELMVQLSLTAALERGSGASDEKTENLTPSQKIDQLKVNLERLRWLPDELGRRHVLVNIAAFKVEAFENGLSRHTYPAIVGLQFRQTPVFSDEIEYIVFNPWWEVPERLARADKLPLFRKDPGAVTRLGYQILDRSGQVVSPATIDWSLVDAADFPYRLRQKPGPQNALGRVKIMFPNPYSVYMHDTPSGELFAEAQRTFSSGCIRVQDPLELATWLLSETPDWDVTAINTAVGSGKETRVPLSAPVPVHVLYLTVDSDGAGNVRYLDDVYSRDQAVLDGLAKPD